MTRHALVLCSRRRAMPARLFGAPGMERVSVITETGHPHSFPSGVEITEIADIQDPGEVLSAAISIAHRAEISHVVSPVEFSQAAGGYVRSTLGLPGLGYDAALGFSNKYVMKRRLREAGLPVTDFAQALSLDDVPEAADRVGWPCVVKPVFGGGCLDIVVLQSREHFDDFASSAQAGSLKASRHPLIVERYVPMDAEFHCDAVVHDGVVEFVAPSRYFTPLLGQIDNFSGSYFLHEGHPDFAPLLDLHARTVQALGMRSGVTHLEVFKVSDGFLVGEVACRPAGGGIPEALQLQYGIDIWQAFLDTSIGRRPQTTVRRRSGIVVNSDFPTRPGRITRIVSEAELAELPGVIRARMTMGVGDVISEDLTSSTSPGLVFYEASDEQEVLSRLENIRNVYFLDASPV
ncbi:ATP-grasp domain-containing protein [Streptomyces sp. NPDC052496]|uniref:ATP-grasp domain-containing protein n=1 Tax=Streptomyces sp. NPDC052496 TaxID=3154951 RepID=UPI0034485364